MIKNASKNIGVSLRHSTKKTIIVVKSTVVPGTTYTYQVGIGGRQTGSQSSGDQDYYQGNATYIQFRARQGQGLSHFRIQNKFNI